MSIFDIFRRNFLKMLSVHIAELEQFLKKNNETLPDNWRWNKETIDKLEVIDRSLMHDIASLHRHHLDWQPDYFSNEDYPIKNLHDTLQKIYRDDLKITNEDAQNIKKFTTLIDELYKTDVKKIQSHIKSKIIDITKDGTCIHLAELKHFESIWKKGLHGGSAITLGPVRNRFG